MAFLAWQGTWSAGQSLSSFLASPTRVSHDLTPEVQSRRARPRGHTQQQSLAQARTRPCGCAWPMGFLRGWPCGSHLTLPSLVLLQSLDSWGTSEDADAPSKRHSTSDLSDTTFSDVRREGWLYYKQVLTNKGKVRWPEECGDDGWQLDQQNPPAPHTTASGARENRLRL